MLETSSALHDEGNESGRDPGKQGHAYDALLLSRMSTRTREDNRAGLGRGRVEHTLCLDSGGLADFLSDFCQRLSGTRRRLSGDH